ncbi:MAG: hypothetical protein ACYSUI_18550 [Planctomycetota bacterium]|jgi:hypothetical protein
MLVSALIVEGMKTGRTAMELYMKMLEGADPEDRKRMMSVIAEREAWWQENFWRPVGDSLVALVEKMKRAEEERG